MNNFDKYTLGNAPAAIYMIDLLNQIERKKAIYIIKSQQEFNKNIHELMDAYEDGALSNKVIRKYIDNYRATYSQKREELLSKSYDEKIINLFENLLDAEFKKAIRRMDAVKRLEVSAISRAKHQLKSAGKTYHDEQLKTYGKYEGEQIPVDVKFNQHGLGSSLINTNLIKDKITSETLMEKSLKRQERRKQK